MPLTAPGSNLFWISWSSSSIWFKRNARDSVNQLSCSWPHHDCEATGWLVGCWLATTTIYRLLLLFPLRLRLCVWLANNNALLVIVFVRANNDYLDSHTTTTRYYEQGEGGWAPRRFSCTSSILGGAVTALAGGSSSFLDGPQNVSRDDKITLKFCTRLYWRCRCRWTTRRRRQRLWGMGCGSWWFTKYSSPTSWH